MRRAAEFRNYCGSTQPVTATFLEGGKPVLSRNTKRRCEIELPAEGCPAHRETAARFADGWESDDDDPARCMRRAGEWVAYCGNNQAVVALLRRGSRPGSADGRPALRDRAAARGLPPGHAESFRRNRE
jgi:hypothetical protein